MYQLIFRNRRYALAWALFMALSAVMFTTTGAGARFTQAKPEAHASEEIRENTYRSWAEDDKRLISDEGAHDPSSLEQVPGDLPQGEEAAGLDRRTAPILQDEPDAELADDTASQ